MRRQKVFVACDDEKLMTATTLTVLSLLSSLLCIGLGVWAAFRSGGTITDEPAPSPEPSTPRHEPSPEHAAPVPAHLLGELDLVSLVTHSTSE